MKTTGVSDIPKFGLLDFLGHPNPESSFEISERKRTTSELAKQGFPKFSQ